jgi:hypothetical protein
VAAVAARLRPSLRFPRCNLALRGQTKTEALPGSGKRTPNKKRGSGRVSSRFASLRRDESLPLALMGPRSDRGFLAPLPPPPRRATKSPGLGERRSDEANGLKDLPTFEESLLPMITNPSMLSFFQMDLRAIRSAASSCLILALLTGALAGPGEFYLLTTARSDLGDAGIRHLCVRRSNRRRRRGVQLYTLELSNVDNRAHSIFPVHC